MLHLRAGAQVRPSASAPGAADLCEDGSMTLPPILVTGATDGIGKETARQLLALGRSVIVHGRNLEKAQRTAEALGKPGGSVEAVGFDLAKLAEVRRGGEELATRFPKLSVLLHNAGVYETSYGRTEDGFERTMAVNHLATVLLTELLLPSLRAAAPARIVLVSSIAHTRAKLDPQDFTLATAFQPYDAYAASKLANVLFARALARRLPPAEVTTCALHPGVIDTKLLRTGFSAHGAPVPDGARTSVYCATSPALAASTGRYFSDVREAAPGKAALDDALGERLWAASRRAVGLS